MRFLHTADLHLGKVMNEVSLLHDQEFVLDQIIDISIREKADVVLIAGDVYQRTSPQAEAMAAFDSFVSRLVEAGKKVFVISGNHDSALRISYFSSLIKHAGVYVTEAFEGTMQHVTLHDTDGDLNVWMLPFVRPAQVRRLLPTEKIVSFQDAVGAVLNNTEIDFSKRNILLCHQFIASSELCDSDECFVGGLDGVDATLFDGFDYVALGHIHKAQRVGRDTVRYAGSPLKYSVSEAQHKKSVVIADVYEKGEVQVKLVSLAARHDVRKVEGMLDDLMRLPPSDDYVWVTIHDELPPPDAQVTLSVNFPYMMKFGVDNSKTKYDLDVLATEQMESKSVIELFSDFYRLQNNDQLPSDAHIKEMNKVIKELEEQPNEAR